MYACAILRVNMQMGEGGKNPVNVVNVPNGYSDRECRQAAEERRVSVFSVKCMLPFS